MSRLLTMREACEELGLENVRTLRVVRMIRAAERRSGEELLIEKSPARAPDGARYLVRFADLKRHFPGYFRSKNEIAKQLSVFVSDIREELGELSNRLDDTDQRITILAEHLISLSGKVS